MAVNLSPVAGAAQQFLDNSGVPLTGGLLYTYSAGTTTPLATYTDNTGVTPNSNPIVLDSAGRVPYEIWLTSGSSYKLVLKTSAGVTLGTWDNIVATTNAVNLLGGAAGQVPWQSGANTTGFVAAGTSGQVFTSGGSGTPTWTSQSALAAGTATTATNLAGGAAGRVPYQSGAGATGFVAVGTTGQYLVSGATGSPTWQTSPWPSRVRTLTSGTTYTLPADVRQIRVFVIGATGGRYASARGGCGGGGFSQKLYTAPSASYTYAIGAGGTNTGGSGGTTTWDSAGTPVSVTGSGGVSSAAQLTGGSGGVASGGDFNANGGVGGTAVNANAAAGGGGAGSRAGIGGAGAASNASSYGGGGGGGGTGGNAGTVATTGTGGAGGIAATALSATAIVGADSISGFTFLAGSTGGNGDLVAVGGDGGTGAQGTESYNVSAYPLPGGQGGLGGIGLGSASTASAGSAGSIVIWEYL